MIAEAFVHSSIKMRFFNKMHDFNEDFFESIILSIVLSMRIFSTQKSDWRLKLVFRMHERTEITVKIN